jgi:spermidine/putrescine transport system substrate-binding protein
MKMKTMAILGLALWATASHGEEKSLNVYNWSEYMPSEVLERFTRETGIEVNYSTYDSNEVMYAKLKTLHEAGSDAGYDIVVPSNYYISKMGREGLLHKLDHEKLSNFEKLDPKLMNQGFDPGNAYSVPYTWGTTGIGINTELMAGQEVNSWTDLWKPEYQQQVLLLDDMREVMGLGLIATGSSVNETDPAKIEAAYLKLKELMPNVRLFDAESPKVKLLEGEVSLAMIWNGEIYMANQEEAGLTDFIYPEEGVMLWIDNLAIPASAPHVDYAHQFIDFLLRPEIAVMIAEEIGYGSPIPEAVAALPEEVRNNPTVYPSEAQLAKVHLQEDIGDALQTYERYWQQLKVD